MKAPCCGRECSHFELTDVTPRLRALLDAVPAAVAKRVRVNTGAAVLCGACRQQLMRRWKPLGGRAVIPREMMGEALTGREPNMRGRWMHDAIDEVRAAWHG